MAFVAAADSPTGASLLAVGDEVIGTVNLWDLDVATRVSHGVLPVEPSRSPAVHLATGQTQPFLRTFVSVSRETCPISLCMEEVP